MDWDKKIYPKDVLNFIKGHLPNLDLKKRWDKINIFPNLKVKLNKKTIFKGKNRKTIDDIKKRKKPYKRVSTSIGDQFFTDLEKDFSNVEKEFSDLERGILKNLDDIELNLNSDIFSVTKRHVKSNKRRERLLGELKKINGSFDKTEHDRRFAENTGIWDVNMNMDDILNPPKLRKVR